MGEWRRGGGRLARAAGVMLVALILASACGWLGTWQWSRAHTRSAGTSAPEGAAAIAHVLVPATDAAGAVGDTVTVTGEPSDPVVLVPGRAIDGSPAVFAVVPLRVAAEESGTQDATLAIIVGWSPPGRDCSAPELPERLTVTGVVRSAETPRAIADLDGSGVECSGPPGTLVSDAISPAALANVWDGPLYSAAVSALDAPAGWTALPAPAIPASLNLQSAAYAIEWWAFGLFALALGVRTVRQNGGAWGPAPEGAGDE